MDIAKRKFYVGLFDKVVADGGEVRILSGDHESGQRLEGFGGIAATLTYPMFDLDEKPEGEEGLAAGEDGGGRDTEDVNAGEGDWADSIL